MNQTSNEFDLALLPDDLAAKSDQLNADDLMAPVTVTIVACKRGATPEQPWNLHMREFPGKPFRPCKTMRRLLVHAWGEPSPEWLGRSLQLYRDADVRFGDAAVGGIRIAALSHLRGPIVATLTAKRGGKKATHRVEVLATPATATATAPGLEAALSAHGLTVADWDAYAAAHGRTPYDAMSPQQRAAAARWLPAHADEVRAAQPPVSP